jgi:hypothetical protein
MCQVQELFTIEWGNNCTVNMKLWVEMLSWTNQTHTRTHGTAGQNHKRCSGGLPIFAPPDCMSAPWIAPSWINRCCFRFQRLRNECTPDQNSFISTKLNNSLQMSPLYGLQPITVVQRFYFLLQGFRSILDRCALLLSYVG